MSVQQDYTLQNLGKEDPAGSHPTGLGEGPACPPLQELGKDDPAGLHPPGAR